MTSTVIYQTGEFWSSAARLTAVDATDVLVFPTEQSRCVFAITSSDVPPALNVQQGAPIFEIGREMRLVPGDRLWLASPHGEQVVTVVSGETA